MVELGWKFVGVFEFMVLFSFDEECWVLLVCEVDVLLVLGGDVFYLCYWMW